MKFVELLEGAEPKMPGAPSGIKIMTPQQFVAKSGDMPDEKDEELKEFAPYDHNDDGDYDDDGDDELRSLYDTKAELEAELDYADEEDREHLESELEDVHARIKALKPDATLEEGKEHLDRIRSLSGLGEATKLPAPSREFGTQEFQDYMNRIVGRPDIDKKTGQVKKQKDRIDKKTGEIIPGAEKYVSGKTKSDRYKMPYIHRSSAIRYIGPDGKTFSEDAVKQTLKQRPKNILKQNEKMKHSNGQLEQFFNVGFAALTGIAVDEDTDKLIIVNTCPGAGSCKIDCFQLGGNKIMFEAPWQSDGRLLTYVLNDPDGFFNKVSAEISKEEKLGQRGGYDVSIRWHDGADFFSPEYLDMAFKLAAKHPNVKFYAYTKMANAALAQKPANFIINWSEGAHTSQEKQVKASDANLDKTKNSRIVPEKLFWDLLKKDEKGNLDKEGADEKGKGGRWVTRDKQATQELKQRLAKEYGLSANSILNYDEYMAKRNSIPAGMKYNVIVAPGEGDVSANDNNILSTLLLKH